jgi:hypothetical protein
MDAFVFHELSCINLLEYAASSADVYYHVKKKKKKKSKEVKVVLKKALDAHKKRLKLPFFFLS